MADGSFDLVIRGGTVVDGTGGEPFEADVAIRDGFIVEVSKVLSRGEEEIDAHGCIVTPGFTDIHTHYDGQVTWEHRMGPSSSHGVTTVVMGNCGVGFAPCKPQHRDMLIQMMEGVEDIPEVVMADGVPWNWETFPDYLDAIEQRHADVDFAAQLPHNPLRVYVMGERGAACEVPTAEDLSEMRRLTAEAVRAGAVGVSTTRNFAHHYRDGRPVPTTTTADEETLALAAGLRDAGAGVFEILNDMRKSPEEQVAHLRDIAEASGRPVSFTLTQVGDDETGWRTIANGIEQALEEGLPIRAQVMPRPVGFLFGLDLSMHAFAFKPSFRPLQDLPLAEKVAAMRDPDMRHRLLSEEGDDPHPYFRLVSENVEGLYLLGNPPNYHPEKTDSIADKARRAGVDPLEAIYELLLEDEGRAVLYRPAANCGGERFEQFGAELIGRDLTLLGLGDGGAHYGMICDAALPTYFLTHWVGHEDPAKRVELPAAIKMLASDTAQAIGFTDRGRVEAGMKADLNVIDMMRLKLYAPRTVNDLPAGGRRMVQHADGYEATIVSGQVTYRNGQATGALPGRLVRGAR